MYGRFLQNSTLSGMTRNEAGGLLMSGFLGNSNPSSKKAARRPPSECCEFSLINHSENRFSPSFIYKQ